MVSAFFHFVLYFNPRAPRGARPTKKSQEVFYKNFNPRAPRGARPAFHLYITIFHVNFNPRAPRGARQQKNTKQKSVLCDKHRIL